VRPSSPYRPGRRYCGLIVVARVPTGRHPILTAHDGDDISAVLVSLTETELLLVG
jgi:hypothetical protein